ncbi:MAG: polysaccharide biosynthesis/export family protein [Desulfobacterales bacterium]
MLAIFIASALIGCASQSSNIKAVEPLSPAQVQAPVVYTIAPGDELDIKFFYNPELNETVIVRPDGVISLQLVDEIHAAGMTPAELDQKLTDLYSRELRKPVVTVIVRSFTRQRVFVGGEVTTPGLVELPTGMTALQAVFQSGGFKETAEPSETLIIRKGEKNKPIPIRIDLASVMVSGGGNDLQLQADDIVYVPKSAIANANKFIDEYISGLLMFRGWSFGVSQSLGLSSDTF